MRVLDGYVRRLDAAIVGSPRTKGDVLREVSHSLADAAEAYEAEGLTPHEAELRAVDEFGAVAELAPAFQAELATSATRTLAVRVTAAFGVLVFAADLMWRGAPWTAPRPPMLYTLLSGAVDRVSMAVAVFGVIGLLALWLTARAGGTVPARVLRLANRLVAVLLGFVWVVGVVMFAWSAVMWQGALTWPPMLIGSVVMSAAALWIGRATLTSLRATRATRADALDLAIVVPASRA
jgi:hypothetical protein